MRPHDRILLIALGASAIISGCGSWSPARSSNAVNAKTIQSLGLPDAENSTPVLAASGNWVVVVWTASGHERTNVYAAASGDGGVRFAGPVRVNDVEGEAHVYGEDPPRVALAPTAEPGRTPEIVVTWPSDRAKHLGLRSARSGDGGRTFLPSTSIGDEAVVGERGFQSVTVGGDHVVRAVWLDQRRDPGGPVHKNVEGDWDPMHLMFASASRDGRWMPETRLATNVCGCCKTAVVTGGDGSVYVAFRNIYPGSLRDISLSVSRDGGRTFMSPVRISEDRWELEGCPDDGPTMAIDHDGVVHVVWPTLVQGAQPAIGLFQSSTRDGVTFTPRQRIATLGTAKPAHPQLTVDTCGTLTVVWDEVQASIRRALMRQLTPLASGDVRIGDVRLLSGSHSAVYPVVAAVPDGVIAAWADISGAGGEHADIAVRRVAFGGACDVPTNVAVSMSIANAVNDRALAIQRYPLNGAIVSVDRAGKTLTIDHQAIPGFMGAMTMSYAVRDSHAFEWAAKGALVTATVVRTGDDYWLEDVARRAMP